MKYTDETIILILNIIINEMPKDISNNYEKCISTIHNLLADYPNETSIALIDIGIECKKAKNKEYF